MRWRRRTRRCARRAPLPCPTSSPPAICWSSTTPPPCPRRCADTTTPATRSRRASSPRAARIASAPCCSAPATGTSGRRIARPRPRCRSARACGSARSPPRSSRIRRRRRAWWSCASPPRGDALWAALYREGRPVQYSYLAHDLPLWAVQTVYAARPWAFEMPSAGRPLSWEILLALRRKGVRWASLTHAAGLSSTGDPAIDAALPLAERYDIPAATVRAVADTRARGGRVIAVGTTVVRALEGAAVEGRRPARRPRRDRPDHHARVPPPRRRRHPVRRPRRAREPLLPARRLRRPRPARRRRRPRRPRRLPDPRARRLDARATRRAGDGARASVSVTKRALAACALPADP